MIVDPQFTAAIVTSAIQCFLALLISGWSTARAIDVGQILTVWLNVPTGPASKA